MSQKQTEPNPTLTQHKPDPEETTILSKASAWDAAKAEYLDPSRPKPRYSVLALKYNIDVASLMRTSVANDWDSLRSKAETAAIIQVTPEARAGVLQQLDTIIVKTMREAAQEAGSAYVEAIRRVRNLEIEEEEEEDDDEPRKKRKGKTKKYSLNAQANLLNTLTEGISNFSKAVKDLGWSLNPETEVKGGDVLKNAINVTAVPSADTPPPPPIPQPEPKKIQVDVAPPPPPPPAT